VGRAYEAGDGDPCRGYHAAQGLSGFFRPVDRPLDGGGDALGLGDIDGEEPGRGGELLGQGVAVVLVLVQEGYIAALLDNLLRRRSAEAGCPEDMLVRNRVGLQGGAMWAAHPPDITNVLPSIFMLE